VIALQLCVGLCGLQMCQMCVGRISIFFVRWGKNKKHSVGQRVGLDAVQLQYGLYVFGHLSKLFVFGFMFKFWSVGRLWNGRPTIGYNLYIIDELVGNNDIKYTPLFHPKIFQLQVIYAKFFFILVPNID